MNGLPEGDERALHKNERKPKMTEASRVGQGVS
jgi:hypothetical protein